MTLGLYRSDFINAEEIEVILYTTKENQLCFRKSDGSLITSETGACYVYLYTTLLDAGIIYCQYRTTINGLKSQWYQRQIAFRQ